MNLLKWFEWAAFDDLIRTLCYLLRSRHRVQIVAQQFEFGKKIISKGLIPILEPEVNIDAPDKGECEALLLGEIVENVSIVSRFPNRYNEVPSQHRPSNMPAWFSLASSSKRFGTTSCSCSSSPCRTWMIFTRDWSRTRV
jgi:hypothetical protein